MALGASATCNFLTTGGRLWLTPTDASHSGRSDGKHAQRTHQARRAVTSADAADPAIAGLGAVALRVLEQVKCRDEQSNQPQGFPSRSGRPSG